MPALTTLIPIIALVGEFMVRLGMAAVILIRARGRPASRFAWLLVVITLPFIGTIAYLMIGEIRLGRRRIRQHQQIEHEIQTISIEFDNPPTHPPPVIDDRFRHLHHLASAVGHTYPTGGNAIALYHDTRSFIDALIDDIDHATSQCHLLYYIVLTDDSSGRVADALIRAAHRGVKTRLLVDAVGANTFAGSSLRARLVENGVQVIEALPANFVRMLFQRIDVRNHRKIAVIDGHIGYMGSHNIADPEFAPKPRFAPWIDVSVRTEGPIVRDLERVFIEDWYLDSGESLAPLLDHQPERREDDVIAQLVATGPGRRNEAMRQLIQVALHSAREELILTTPYFVPDEPTLSALCASAARGIDTTLVVPARNDSPVVGLASRSFYEPLLEAGATILEYNAGLLHAKTITVDRQIAIVSTANLDRRSFEINFEASLIVFDSDFASRLRLLQRTYMEDTTAISALAWERRAWYRRLAQNTAGLLGPLL